MLVVFLIDTVPKKIETESAGPSTQVFGPASLLGQTDQVWGK